TGAVFENKATFAATNDATIGNNGGAQPSFINSGTFSKSSAANGTTTIGVQFNNSGTVNVASGTLNLTGGGSDAGGSYAIASGGRLVIGAGNYMFPGRGTSGGLGTCESSG